ncbi:MAG: DUF3747 domain-containing protein [Cyanobacteriota bacterium]|nr:DUF3747 domain-containing protein [Cyanobacteriota bacterium]
MGLRSRHLGLAAVAALAAPLVLTAQQGRAAGSLFQTMPLEQTNFVLVAAPIGNGTKAQLNIYEQVRSTRPCFAIASDRPAPVEPLLASFDFTGICGRYIDANGYSLRVGESDLGTSYRLSVVRSEDDNVLMAIPTKAGAGPEMVVARTMGSGNGYLQLVFEPGWELKRRAFDGRALGHVYVYRDSWPEATASADPAQTPASPAAGPTGTASEQPESGKV